MYDKFFVEIIGTFIFLSVILISGEAIPIGIALAAMIYFGAGVSGGAYNPAVSLAQFLKGDLNGTGLAVYIIAQIIGAVLAFIYYKKYYPKIK